MLVDSVLGMYRDGWFPMHDPEEGEVRWVQPHLRGIIPLEPEGFHIPRTLRSRIRRSRFRVTTDSCFQTVMRECAVPTKGRESTWIDESIRELFEVLHRAGHAHSIEAWRTSPDGDELLVGGLYGLAIGSVFCGESMFSRPNLGGSDASKVCLVHLVHHLRRRGFSLLDTQLVNQHLVRFGCREMKRGDYLRHVSSAAAAHVPWDPFEPEKLAAEL